MIVNQLQIQLIWFWLLTHHFLVSQTQPSLQSLPTDFIVSWVYCTCNEEHYKCWVSIYETSDPLNVLCPLLQSWHEDVAV